MNEFVPYPSIESLSSDGFGHWLAGFVDGEGCFLIHCHNDVNHRCVFRVKLRADDGEILREAVRRTGLGYLKLVKTIKPLPNPQLEWLINKKRDSARLVEIFSAFPLRAKKSRDFAIWSRAVAALLGVRNMGSARNGRWGGTMRHANQQIMGRLRLEMNAGRRFQVTQVDKYKQDGVTREIATVTGDTPDMFALQGSEAALGGSA